MGFAKEQKMTEAITKTGFRSQQAVSTPRPDLKRGMQTSLSQVECQLYTHLGNDPLPREYCELQSLTAATQASANENRATA